MYLTALELAVWNTLALVSRVSAPIVLGFKLWVTMPDSCSSFLRHGVV